MMHEFLLYFLLLFRRIEMCEIHLLKFYNTHLSLHLEVTQQEHFL